MTEIYPPDYTSDVGRVRKYIPDIAQLPDPRDPMRPDSYMWDDESIQSFLNDEMTPGAEVPTPRAVIFRAAAYIMIATANNENLILKKLVTEDLQTDGPAVSKALLASAQELLKRAASDDPSGANEEIFIDVPYTMYPDYGYVGHPRTLWGL